jgi:hypothetical protein
MMGTGQFLGLKWLVCGIHHPPPPTSIKVKERAELYLYSPAVPSWQDILYLYLYNSTPLTSILNKMNLLYALILHFNTTLQLKKKCAGGILLSRFLTTIVYTALTSPMHATFPLCHLS